MTFLEHVQDFIRRVFNLRADRATDEEIKERIFTGGQVRGTNMCILILAVFIASIGLNMNSPAVIIGAMLVSPLMGGIMSMGYGLATLDLIHFRDALFNFLFQVFISLAASTVYFFLSPIQSATSELLARTMPTIWDVLIAVCGGTAGIIASTRKDRVSNVIPGVAIATALMPPLCTAGYGLATGQWAYMLGALYLFFINTFFICLTSVLVLRLLHVTSRRYESKTILHRVRVGIVAIALVTILPSVYLGWQIAEQNISQVRYKQFVDEAVRFDSTQVVRSDFDTKTKTVSLALIGTTVPEEEIKALEAKLPDYGLSGGALRVTQMEVKQGVTEEQLQTILSQQKTDADKNSQQLTELQAKLQETTELLEVRSKLEEQVKQVESEIMVLYPKVRSAGAVSMRYADGSTVSSIVTSVTEPLSPEEAATLQNWLQTRLGSEVRLIETAEPPAPPPEEPSAGDMADAPA